MADELKDALLGGLDAKRQLFADEDFAGDFGRGVAGRVKRRRALSVTAAGGVSLAGVGAVAFGASQVPWSGWVFAGPAASPYVVCTTTTPDAVEPTAETSWPPKIFTFTDPSDGSTADVALSADEDPVLQTDGAMLVALEDGDYRLTLPNGAQATIGFGIFLVGLPEGTNPNDYLTVSVFDGDVDVTSQRALSGDPTNVVEVPTDEWVVLPNDEMVVLPNDTFTEVPIGGASWAIESTDGIARGTAILDGENLAITMNDEATFLVEPRDDGSFRIPLGDTVYVWRIAADGTVAVATEVSEAATASPSPEVTCVTTTPEPSDVLSESVSTSAVPTASSNPAWNWSPTVPASDTPFDCGTELGAESYSDPHISVVEADWKSVDDVNVELAALYGDPERAPQSEATGPLPVGAFTEHLSATLTASNITGFNSQTDPSTQMEAMERDHNGQNGSIVGTTFVAVRDGVIVGKYKTGDVTKDSATYLEMSPPQVWGLVDDGMLPCTDGALEDAWDMYVVGGVAATDGLNWTGPEYAWQKLDPAE